MNKRTKNIILLACAIVMSIVCTSCGKIHNEISQIRVTRIAVGNTKAFFSNNNLITNQIDTSSSYCCSSDGDYEVEPFYDGQVRFTIKNTLNYDIELSHYYYVVKNYYGGGNDYISPNLSFIGDAILDGTVTEGGISEVTTYGQFTDISNGAQRFSASNEMIQSVGTKNVIFYITAISEKGEILTFSRSIAVIFENINQCEDEMYPCSAQG